MSFLTRLLHSCTALSKSSETSKLFGGGLEGSIGLEGFLAEGVAKGRITVALLNFEAEKRVQILLIVSCGGNFFFFFDFDLLPPKGAGGFGGLGRFRLPSLSLSLANETDEDIFAAN